MREAGEDRVTSAPQRGVEQGELFRFREGGHLNCSPQLRGDGVYGKLSLQKIRRRQRVVRFLATPTRASRRTANSPCTRYPSASGQVLRQIGAVHAAHPGTGKVEGVGGRWRHRLFLSPFSLHLA